MGYKAPQANFSKGELGPDLYGRFDVDAWKAAVKQARNVVVLKYGGLTKRLGFNLVSEVLDDSAPTRLIPFQFSTTQTYALEFGQGYISPVAFGGRLLDEELAITNITSEAEAIVTAAYHGYVVGDLVFIDGVKGDMGTLLNGQFWRVTEVIDTDNFRIAANTADVIFTGSNDGITRVSAGTPTPTPTVPPIVVEEEPPVTSPAGGGGGGYGRETGVNLDEY